MASCLEAEPRENKQVVFRIRGGEHIQAIAEIIALLVGIPSDVTVRLTVYVDSTAAAAPLFQTSAGMFFAFPYGSIDRGTVPGKGKVEKVNQSSLHRVLKEKIFKDVIKTFTGAMSSGINRFQKIAPN